MAGLAARRRAGIENALARLAARPAARRAARRRPGSTRRRRRSPADPRHRRRLEQQRLVVEQAVGHCDAARRKTRAILRAGGAAPIDAQPERRALIVRSENRLGLLAPIGCERIDEPARMRSAHGDVAIDLCAELHVLALTASQDRIEKPAARGCPSEARCIDRFSDGRMRGNVRVQQLAQPDDRERAHVRLELLSGTREQALEQCIQAEVPANAVVGERAKQTALLARGLRIDRQRGIERTTAHATSATICAAAARTAAERLTTRVPRRPDDAR